MTCLDAQRVRSGLSWDTFHIARTRLVFKYCKNSVKTGGFKKNWRLSFGLSITKNYPKSRFWFQSGSSGFLWFFNQVNLGFRFYNCPRVSNFGVSKIISDVPVSTDSSTKFGGFRSKSEVLVLF
jgi:hypothetical protein